MKKFLSFIFGIALLALIALISWNIYEKMANSQGTSKSITMKERSALSVDDESFIYEVIEGEATVKGSLIDRVLVGKNVTVTYRNKTSESLRPGYLIKFYNQYGVMIGKKKIGSFSLTDLMVGPEEVASESIAFERYNITEILEHSDVRIKEDFDKIKWVVISESNSEVSVASK